MSTVQHLEFTLSTLVPRSPTYHCLVPSRTLSPTKKLLETEEDEEGDGQQAIDVFVPEKRMRYSCPRQFIGHAGYGEKMVVCSAYSCAIEAGQAPSEITACAMGNQCRFVHIDVPLTQLKGDIIHVHYIYREAALCPYERLSTAMIREHPQTNPKVIDDLSLMIYGPNNREPVERIPVTHLLLTGGSRYAYDCAVNPRRGANGQTSEPPRVCHCAHYYFTQTCNRGSNCSFIHVVSIDSAQKADSTKPTNYRRRVGQLGQSEVPQMAMTPQVAYHSTPMGSQANTPLTGQHISRSPGSNQHSSPFLQNTRSPFNPTNKATFNSTSSPYLPMDNTQIGFDSYNNSTNLSNIGPHNNGYSSRSPPVQGQPQSTDAQWQQGNTNKTTSVYVGHRPQQPLEPVHQQAREQVTVGLKPNNQSHFPPSPTVQQHQTATKQLPTSMLPMDDVDDEGANDHQAAQQGYPSSYTNYRSNPDFTLGTQNGAGSNNYYTEGLGSNSNTAEFVPKQQYVNSNRASPMHTPSTGMHMMPSTPKVSAGRYAHNPYAGSPVTAMNQV